MLVDFLLDRARIIWPLVAGLHVRLSTFEEFLRVFVKLWILVSIGIYFQLLF